MTGAEGGSANCLLGVGPMGIQIPPAGAMDTLNWRDINTPAPTRANVRFG